jgi:hypothetical protein
VTLLPGWGPPGGHGRPKLRSSPQRGQRAGEGEGPRALQWRAVHSRAPTSAIRATSGHGFVTSSWSLVTDVAAVKRSRAVAPIPPPGSRSLECGRVAGSSGGGTRAATTPTGEKPFTNVDHRHWGRQGALCSRRLQPAPGGVRLTRSGAPGRVRLSALSLYGPVPWAAARRPRSYQSPRDRSSHPLGGRQRCS